MDKFIIADAFTHKKEGGYVDDPNDPGGATRYGITIGTLRKWRRSQGDAKPVTKAHVRTLPMSEAQAIYRAWYWDAVRGDQLPLSVGICVYDFGVNSGPKRAILRLQKVIKKLGLVITVDGKIGPQTLSAVDVLVSRGRLRELVTRYGAERFMFYAGLPTFPHFRGGWSHRNSDVIWEAAKWALTLAADPQIQPLAT